MNKQEAEEIKKLIDSFVESEGQPEEQTESVKEEKPQVELTEDELKKLFRNEVPEGFDIKESEAIRFKGQGDRVFLKFKNEIRWVPDPETLERLGFNFAEVQELPDEEKKNYQENFGLLPVRLW